MEALIRTLSPNDSTTDAAILRRRKTACVSAALTCARLGGVAEDRLANVVAWLKKPGPDVERAVAKQIEDEKVERRSDEEKALLYALLTATATPPATAGYVLAAAQAALRAVVQKERVQPDAARARLLGALHAASLDALAAK